jgi:hypothetical protein
MVISHSQTFFDVSDRNFRIVQSGVGLNEIDDLNQVSIYPNPATNLVTIDWKGELTKIRITDSKGRVLSTIDNPNGESHQLDIANYSAGMYYIYVESQFGASVYDVIKQ